MYEIIQSEGGIDFLIAKRETIDEAEDYVSALTDMHLDGDVIFFYRSMQNHPSHPSNSPSQPKA